MAIEHVLAAVPVTDLDSSRRRYESLIGRAADNNPMLHVAEWQVVRGWVQVFADRRRAGSTAVNFAVQDLDAHIDDLKQRGLEPGEIVDANRARACRRSPTRTGTRSR